MGYPSQPNGPYGQQPPPGYGYQPPTQPPPPKKSNTLVIVLLAVGVPLLLLASCTAVFVAIGDGAPRESVVTQPNPTGAQQPPAAVASAPQETQAAEEPAAAPSAAQVGGAITLKGMDDLTMAVTLNQVFDPATPAEDYMKPKAGTKFVALQLTLENAGQTVYSGSPSNGAYVIDDQGQQYQATYARVREGQGFDGTATISAGDARKGVILFAVPEAAKLVKFQYALNSGFADQKGEWALQ
ncbi:DUF4352 domain-containing protein [Nonomuraea sp. NPDC050790]|uniref:DUF4352 domain-containing protein n=1 Tax=Nonomuraea sp. NPDC050790 TaxID=3364371 RepID=UPI00378975EB